MSIPRISVLDRLFFLVFGGMIALMVGLYGLGFDLVESQGWQVGVYHLMLVLLASMPVIVSLSPFWDLGGLRLRLWMTVIALFMPAVVLAFDWFQGGTYAGFRDPRLMIMVSVSTGVSGMLLGAVGFTKATALVFVLLLRHVEHPLFAVPALLWLLPEELLALESGQPGDSVEGEVHD